jgi:hypothetical protein
LSSLPALTRDSSHARPSWWLYTAALLLVAAVLSAIALGGFSAISAYWKRTGKVAPGGLRKSALGQALYDRPYRQLMRIVARQNAGGRFDAVWDNDVGVSLSRDLYVETRMYGEPRYRYRPHLRALDITVWSGLHYQSLLVPDTEAVRAAADRCNLVQKTVFDTDENGFKTSGPPPEPGVPSVLFVGDSFTEGLHVAAAETFSEQFGRLARKRGLRVRAVNAGLNGYGPLEECWTIENWAVPLDAALVVVNLFPNDVAPDFTKVVAGEVPDSAYEAMWGWLERIRKFCRAHGTSLVIAAIPVQQQLEGEGTSPFQERVAAWCRKSNVPFLDPLQSFRRQGARALYFHWDPHFHAGGHKAYAEFLFEGAQATLEEALRARSRSQTRSESAAMKTHMAGRAGSE